MKTSELLEIIGEKRRMLNQMYSEYKNGMVELANLKNQLLLMLEENGLKSIKSNNYGVSIVTKPKLNILSEQSIREWLENTPDIESDAYIGLKLTPFKSFAIQYFKDTGEMIDGIEYSSEQTLSVKDNK